MAPTSVEGEIEGDGDTAAPAPIRGRLSPAKLCEIAPAGKERPPQAGVAEREKDKLEEEQDREEEGGRLDEKEEEKKSTPNESGFESEASSDHHRNQAREKEGQGLAEREKDPKQQQQQQAAATNVDFNTQQQLANMAQQRMQQQHHHHQQQAAVNHQQMANMQQMMGLQQMLAMNGGVDPQQLAAMQMQQHQMVALQQTGMMPQMMGWGGMPRVLIEPPATQPHPLAAPPTRKRKRGRPRKSAADKLPRAKTVASEPEPSWDERYESLVRFKTRCHVFPASGELHDWLKGQQEAMGDMSPQRARRLFEAGVYFTLEDLSHLREQMGGAAYNAWYAKHTNVNTDGEPDATGGGPKTGRPGDAAVSKFWESAEAAKLFGFAQGEDVLRGLRARMERLRKANETTESWTCLVPDDGKAHLYSDREIMAVRHKALFLIKAYLLAIDQMNQQSWSDCCTMAVAQLDGLGLMSGGNLGFGGKGVSALNRYMRESAVFPHPNRVVKEKPRVESQTVRFLEAFPSAKEMFLKFVQENNHNMTAALMAEEFASSILPALVRDSKERACFDDGSPQQKLLVRILARPPNSETISRTMKVLNIEYDKFGTRRGRNGTSVLSQSMQVAWAAGKYAQRRARGQGLKKGKADDDNAEDWLTIK